MKLNRKEHSNQSGIYCIRNKVNNKVYIGKAKCIYRRIRQHVNNLNKKNRDEENDHLINSWHKYGRENFEYFVVEYVPLDLLKTQELYWQKSYNCTDRKKGYNIRLDSETNCIVSEETRKKCSEAQIKRFKDPKERLKVSHTYWKDNPEATKKMAKRVSESKIKYYINQYTKDGEFVKKWNSVSEITEENKNYKWQQIYSVCSGRKPSIYGYVWKKELKQVK
jgi:group I intron endonuclease